ncbi:hypothetical protein VZT92_009286 [Zoarces viviparus]|uniref:Uncharacterized protein n=1 Tax=Zoarces viviparus TaxID=48416 RepID=A0AAW1FJ79_ZOAVI
MQTRPWYRSPLHRSTTYSPTDLQAQVGEADICRRRRPAADRWTTARREKTRASGQEFWRERKTKDEEGTETGGWAGCMWG